MEKSWYRSTPWWASEEPADEVVVAVELAQPADPEMVPGSFQNNHGHPVPGFVWTLRARVLRKPHLRVRL